MGRNRQDALNFDFFGDEALLSGVAFHFQESVFFGGGRISMPIMKIIFSEPLEDDDAIAIFGENMQEFSENVRRDGILSNLDHLDDLLGGEGSIDYEVI